MSGHPAYIRWFVAGVQAGRRPEELVGNNALLLDFCMSNVYEFLTADARAVLSSMQVLPGDRNQAELAFLNDFTAGRIQSALLELLTTNFVAMSSQASGQTLDTVYLLSEFGKQYLDKRHPVSSRARSKFATRSQQLRDLGSQLTAASTTSPYSPDTISVRGFGDVHVARLLREAVRNASSDPTRALSLCTEAQVLAPSYYEAWRVEAQVRSVLRDHAASITAYERAFELAPDSAPLCFHYGAFLLNEVGDLRHALELLQTGARVDSLSPELAGQISWAHYCLGDMLAAIDAARHVLGMKNANQHETRAAAVVALRAAAAGTRAFLDQADYESAIELVESTVELADSARIEVLAGESYDRLIQLQALTREIADNTDGYLVSKAAEFRARLRERQRCSDPDGLSRVTGILKTVVSQKYFGFVTVGQADYFFHYRDLIDYADWEQLTDAADCAFDPIQTSPRGPRAARVRLLA